MYVYVGLSRYLTVALSSRSCELRVKCKRFIAQSQLFGSNSLAESAKPNNAIWLLKGTHSQFCSRHPCRAFYIPPLRLAKTYLKTLGRGFPAFSLRAQLLVVIIQLPKHLIMQNRIWSRQLT